MPTRKIVHCKAPHPAHFHPNPPRPGSRPLYCTPVVRAAQLFAAPAHPHALWARGLCENNKYCSSSHSQMSVTHGGPRFGWCLKGVQQETTMSPESPISTWSTHLPPPPPKLSQADGISSDPEASATMVHKLTNPLVPSRWDLQRSLGLCAPFLGTI